MFSSFSRIAAVAAATVATGQALAADVPASRIMEAPPVPIAANSPTFTVYSLFDGVYLENRFPGRFYKSHIYQSTNGINISVTPDFSIGGGFIYSYVLNSLTYLNGRSEGDGITGFLTATLNVQNMFTVGAAAGLGRFSSDQVRPVGGISSFADIQSDTGFFSAYIQKDFGFGALTITPRARVLFSTSETGAYFESTGIFNRAETSDLGQAAIGTTMSYAVPVGSMTLYPMLEANFLYDFQRPLYQRDRTAFDVKAGVSATAGKFSFGLAYVTVLGREEYRTYHGGRAFVSYRF